MVSTILGFAGVSPHYELSALFSTVISQNRAQGEEYHLILDYNLPHKRESIYPIGGNRKVISAPRCGENKRSI
jgi:hypothetical protein